MRIVAYVIMALAALTLLPWLAMASMSLMAFDAGFNPMAVLLVGLMLAYPIWLIYFLRRAWQAQGAGDATTAITKSLIGAAPMLLLMAVVMLPQAPRPK